MCVRALVSGSNLYTDTQRPSPTPVNWPAFDDSTSIGFVLFVFFPPASNKNGEHTFCGLILPLPRCCYKFFYFVFFFYFTSGFLTQVLKKLKQEIFSRFILDGTGDSSSPSTPNPPSVWFKSQPVDFITILLLYHWSVERHQWLFTRKPMEIRKTKNQLNIFLLLTFWNPNPVFEFLGGNNKILHFFSPPSPVVL